MLNFFITILATLTDKPIEKGSEMDFKKLDELYNKLDETQQKAFAMFLTFLFAYYQSK